MLYRFTQIGLMLLALALAGCQGCKTPSPPKEPKLQVSADGVEKLRLTKERLAQVLPEFVYESTLHITLSDGAKIQSSVEKISIVGEKSRIHLKKSTDAQHFFELFQDGDQHFIKDRLGPWHRGDQAQAMYGDIIGDGLNLTTWMLEQFYRNGDIKTVDGIIRLDNVPIVSQAPFLADLTSSANKFSSPRRAIFSGVIKLADAQDVLRSAHLEALITAREGAEIRVVADVSLSKKNIDGSLAKPEVAAEEPLEFPVNVRSRFDEIMKNINGGDGHE